MLTTEQFRAKAAGYADLAQTANSDDEAHEFHKRSQDCTRLADNEQWMADNRDKTVHAGEHDGTGTAPERDSAGDAPLAVDEERILRCLGAALIMQWNTLPTGLQKKLFDRAGSVGDLNTGALRAQIARFLHKHKNGEDGIAE
jgi:hypothetical protein